MRKKITCRIALALALLGLTSCGKPSDAPWKDSDRSLVIPADEAGLSATVPEPPENPVSPDAAGSTRGPMLAAYTAVLEDILYDRVFPDGEDHGPFSESNHFAICDVDQDGMDELLIQYTSATSTAGLSEFVLGFDEAVGAVTIELVQYPLLTYYDNGIIVAGWSHSPGKAGDALWPYTFWRYDAKTDTYEAAEMVDAWDKSLVEEGFPDSVDQDGDGVVYYLMDFGDYDLVEPVDNDTYQQWRDTYIGGAEELSIPYVTFNEENIRNLS